MERGEPALKPEWLVRGPAATTSLRPASSSRSDDSGGGGSSRNRSLGQDRDRSSQQALRRGSNGSRRHDRDGTGKSMGYANFGRSNRERGREKDFDFRDRESRLVPADDPLRDGFESFSSCRPERDRLNRARSRVDTWNKGVGVASNNGSLSRNDAGCISFEREFPHLGSEDKNGRQEIGRVPSPGISTLIPTARLGTVPGGWNSVLVDVPIVSEPSNNPVAASVSQAGPSKQPEALSSGTALSMAETVMQAPMRMSTAPQLSIDTQKIEEITRRQHTLRPVTPSANKISVLSSSDKLKNKSARAGDPTGPVKAAPQFPVQPTSYSVCTPVKTDLSKSSQSGSFQVLSREQNGTAHTAKPCTGNPVNPALAPSASVEPPKKPTVNQKLKGAVNGIPMPLPQGSFGERKSNAKDKHKFFESLRTKSANGSSTATELSCRSSLSSLLDAKQYSSHANLGKDFSLFNSGMKRMENESSSCEEVNSCEGSLQHLSNNEEINPSVECPDILDEGSQGLLSDNRDANSSLERADTGDKGSQKLLSDNAEASSLSPPEDSDDWSRRSQFGNDEASLSSEATEAGDEEPDTAEDKPTAEELAFLISLGWDENEVVLPLKQEEIADCLRDNVRLQQKLQECRDLSENSLSKCAGEVTMLRISGNKTGHASFGSLEMNV